MRICHASIALQHALRVKSAEYWLKLGQPMQALVELDRLPRRARKHPWATEVFMCAFRLARSYHGLPAQP